MVDLIKGLLHDGFRDLKIGLVKIVFLLAMAVSLGGVPDVTAQMPGALEPLNVGVTGAEGFSSSVRCLVVQPDGKTIIAGSFISVSGVARQNLARLNTDGTLDMGFDPAVSGDVATVCVQPDGKILLGGEIKKVAGVSRSGVVRLNPDGTLDTTFQSQSGWFIGKIQMQGDGKIVVIGNIDRVNSGGRSYTRGGIFRLHSDGRIDKYFDPNVYYSVSCLTLQADGKMLIAGVGVVSVGGVARSGLVRLNSDGTVDPSVSNPASNIGCIAALPDGKFFVGGSFAANGGLMRLNANGSKDTSFSLFANGEVACITAQADGKFLVAGNFTTLGGQPRNRVARINADGMLDAGFNPDMNNWVYCMAVQADGKVLLGGAFTTVAATPRNLLAQVANDAATQTLSVPELSQVRWDLGGGAAVPSFVTFEKSMDGGGAWLPLGMGSRVGSTPSWRLEGVALSGQFQLRAMGSVNEGLSGRHSGWLTQTAAFDIPTAPKLVVKGNGLMIQSGDSSPDVSDHTDFRAASVSGGEVVRSYSITNGGTEVLNLTGSPVVTIAGAHAADFRVSAGSAAVILAPGSSISFQITFDPSIAGARTAMVSIASNDAASPYVFSILGMGDPSNANLAQLSVNGDVLSPVFAPATKSYSLSLGYENASLELRPVTEDVNATVKARVNGGGLVSVPSGGVSSPLPLNVGSNVVDILVTAQDGITTEMWTLSVTRGGPPGAVTAQDAVIQNISTLVRTTSAGPDGRTFLAGGFMTLQGRNRPGIACLNADGTLNMDFDVDITGEVKAIWVQPDGKILLGGSFSRVNNVVCNCLVRVDGNGDIDSSFNFGLSSSQMSSVGNIAVQPDGKILLNAAIRLNADGTVDSGYTPPIQTVDVNGSVRTSFLQDDGKILIGGTFSSIDGVARKGMARLNSDGTLDLTFKNPRFGSDDMVLDMARQGDGKIVVAGRISSIGGVSRAHIGRLNADGTVDAGFNPQASTLVHCVSLQADGKILCGGLFTTMGGVTRHGVARLDPDGTLDMAFDPNVTGDSSTSVTVHGVTARADGTIDICGTFSFVGGVARRHYARVFNDATVQAVRALDARQVIWTLAGGAPDLVAASFERSTDGGASWDTMGSGFRVGSSSNWKIMDLLLTGSGLIRAQGRAHGTGGLMQTIAAYNVNPGPQMRVTGNGAVISAGDNMPAASDYTDFGSTNLAGSVARTFTIANHGPANLHLCGSPQVVISGGHAADFTVTTQPPALVGPSGSSTFQVLFHPLGTELRSAMLRIQNDGGEPLYHFSLQGFGLSSDASLVGLVPVTESIAPDFLADTTAYTASVGFRKSQFPILPLSTHVRATVQARVNEGSYAAVASGDSPTNLSLVVGVNTIQVLVTAEDLVTTRLYTLTVTRREAGPGDVDVQINTLVAGSSGPTVIAAASQPDGKLIICGHFATVNNNTRNRVARLNVSGTLDTGFNPNANGVARCLLVLPNGKILIGGAFLTVGGIQRNYLARVNADGTVDATFNASVEGVVSGLALQPDGKIILAGSFLRVGGTSIRYVARVGVDGELDTTFNPGATGAVSCVAVEEEGKIVLGGSFQSMGGQMRTFVARVHADGTLDTSFNPNANGAVGTLVLQPDGQIILAGSFTMVGAVVRNRIARLDKNGILDQGFAPEAGGTVTSMAMQSDGKLVLGGSFTALSGQPRNRVARLMADGTLDPEFDPDANNDVYCVALREDGQVFLGGIFTTVGGLARPLCATLVNNPAIQSLVSLHAGSVFWERGGSAPGLSAVNFEHCADGGSVWTSLGAGSRVNATPNWQLQGLNLPPQGMIRACGFIAGSAGGKGSGLVESVVTYDRDQNRNSLRDEWERAYWTDGSSHGPLDDDDHDGVVNLLEMAFGRDPTRPDGGALAPARDEGGYFTVTIAKQAGVCYLVQTAGSLMPEAPDFFSASTTTVLVNDATTLKVRDNVLISSTPSRFMRVQVSGTP